MKLLFVTQKIDLKDDLLGVYHEWVRSLAGKFDKISIICLQKGEYDLPENVAVYSLGKESKPSRLRYLFSFYYLIFKLRRDYERVFVHMNPEYVILGGPFWKLMRKKVVLWYAHYLATFKLRLAVKFADQVVTSVPQAFPYKSSKVLAVGQGIQAERFSLDHRSSAHEPRLLFLGRISPIKDLETLIYAAEKLRASNQNFKLNIYGAPTERDQDYAEKMHTLVKALNLSSNVSFLGRVPNSETPKIYADHDIFINLTRTGSFDKSTLEAMASKLPVLVANRAFEEILLEDLKPVLIFKENDPNDLSKKIEFLIKKSPADRLAFGEILRGIIVKNHSLARLSDKLCDIFSRL